MYEVPVRQSKEEMRTEIERLKSQQTLNERILAALVSPDDAELVLDQLRSGETLEAITEGLNAGKSTSSIAHTQSRGSIASSSHSNPRFNDPYAEASHSGLKSSPWGEWEENVVPHTQHQKALLKR